MDTIDQLGWGQYLLLWCAHHIILCITLGCLLQISTGASDDIRRCSSLAFQTVSEYGLSRVIGPLSVNTLSSGGSDEPALIGRDSGVCTALCISSCHHPRYHPGTWNNRALLSRLATDGLEDLKNFILVEKTKAQPWLRYPTQEQDFQWASLGLFGGPRQLAKAKAMELARAALAAAKDNAVACAQKRLCLLSHC